MTELWSEYALRLPRGLAIRSFELGVCHDNVLYNSTGATSVATDTIGGVEYQRLKPAVGPDGTANDVVGLADLTTAAASHAGILAATAPDRRFTSQNLSGTAVSSTTTWDCQGAGVATVYITTGTTGTIRFEVSSDGTNFLSAEVFDTASDAVSTVTDLASRVGSFIRRETRPTD